jgi:hypothetical protein
LKGAGDQKKEAYELRAKMRASYRCQVIVALLLSLAVILSAVGCGTSSLGSYQSAFQSTNGSMFNMHEWRFEHNLLNSKYQKVEKEDWEDDGPG